MAHIISTQQLKGRQKGIIIQVKPPGPSTSPVVEKTQKNLSERKPRYSISYYATSNPPLLQPRIPGLTQSSEMSNNAAL